jgi:hydroxymethylpyrimidine/phosphomethylpyrimidine kinase
LLAAELVKEQIEAVIGDIAPAAAKTGALGNEQIVAAVADLAASFEFPLVVDPVMISKHGARLMSSEAESVLKRKLLPHAALVTPNIPEAEALTGMSIANEDDMVEAAQRILDFGCKAVLLKGGHRVGNPTDVLVMANAVERLPGWRIETSQTHGTGCTYSAAITAGLAKGEALMDAVRSAKEFIQHAIETAPGLGHGCGPISHFAPINTWERPDRPYRSKR